MSLHERTGAPPTLITESPSRRPPAIARSFGKTVSITGGRNGTSDSSTVMGVVESLSASVKRPRCVVSSTEPADWSTCSSTSSQSRTLCPFTATIESPLRSWANAGADVGTRTAPTTDAGYTTTP